MKSQTCLWCLHGNLQRGSVWKSLSSLIERPLKTVDLFDQPIIEFSRWARQFCDEVAEEAQGQPQWLLGYSMGGRLAMHALLHAPELWQGVVLAGADPGAYPDDIKAAQLAFDNRWGERFLTDKWSTLLGDWNAQTVFCGKENPLPPMETDFDRQQIAIAFDRWSKGRQANLLPKLQLLTHPRILCVSGEEDVKYQALGEQLQANCPTVTHRSVPGVGHRVPWEAPEVFCEAVNQFVEE